jgi:anti-sigma regulatory factor (Ser/Thr protein kinase)
MEANRVTLRTSAAAGQQVAAFVCSLAERVGLSEGRAYRLRLAADEIVTNIGLHGYHGRPGPVELVGGIDPDAVWLSIIDEAPAFDPTGHDPGPRLQAGPDHDGEGGFGLFLALRGLDDFRYGRSGGRNENTLIMRRPVGDRPGPRRTETS